MCWTPGADDVKAYSEVETAIPGKVVRYLANQ